MGHINIRSDSAWGRVFCTVQ